MKHSAKKSADATNKLVDLLNAERVPDWMKSAVNASSRALTEDDLRRAMSLGQLSPSWADPRSHPMDDIRNYGRLRYSPEEVYEVALIVAMAMADMRSGFVVPTRIFETVRDMIRQERRHAIDLRDDRYTDRVIIEPNGRIMSWIQDEIRRTTPAYLDPPIKTGIKVEEMLACEEDPQEDVEEDEAPEIKGRKPTEAGEKLRARRPKNS